MDLQLLKKLVKILEHSSIDEIEIEQEGVKVRVARNSTNGVAMQPVYAQGYMPQQMPQQSSAHASNTAPEKPAEPTTPQHEVRSPIVGTFYRAPAPDADSYVEVGAVVEKGTVLCIIEAMKLMNEIESDVAGRVVKCCVDNAKPVEYNQPLFIIEPA